MNIKARIKARKDEIAALEQLDKATEGMDGDLSPIRMLNAYNNAVRQEREAQETKASVLKNFGVVCGALGKKELTVKAAFPIEDATKKAIEQSGIKVNWKYSPRKRNGKKSAK